jgi:multiple antibiotic resistance protein
MAGAGGGAVEMMSTFSAAALLFVVMDPVGNVPPFLVVLQHVEPAQQKRVLVRELFIALFVLVFFLFAGQFVLAVFHISEPSLSIAGGIILFLIALRMIFGAHEAVFGDGMDKEPFIVPLAVPYLAGPSAIATVMLLATREPQRWGHWLLALGLAWACSAVILYFARHLRRLLGEHGLTAVERLMGLLLTAVAVEMSLAGISEFLRKGVGGAV